MSLLIEYVSCQYLIKCWNGWGRHNWKKCLIRLAYSGIILIFNGVTDSGTTERGSLLNSPIQRKTAIKFLLFLFDISSFSIFLYCVKSVRIRSYSGPHFLAFRLNTKRWSLSLQIQSECGKMRTRIAQNTDTFYAVMVISNFITRFEIYHTNYHFSFDVARNNLYHLKRICKKMMLEKVGLNTGTCKGTLM